MIRPAVLSCLALLALRPALADEGRVKIALRDGSAVEGTLLDKRGAYRVRLDDGSVRELAEADVRRVTFAGEPLRDLTELVPPDDVLGAHVRRRTQHLFTTPEQVRKGFAGREEWAAPEFASTRQFLWANFMAQDDVWVAALELPSADAARAVYDGILGEKLLRRPAHRRDTRLELFRAGAGVVTLGAERKGTHATRRVFREWLLARLERAGIDQRGVVAFERDVEAALLEVPAWARRGGGEATRERLEGLDLIGIERAYAWRYVDPELAAQGYLFADATSAERGLPAVAARTPEGAQVLRCGRAVLWAAGPDPAVDELLSFVRAELADCERATPVLRATVGELADPSALELHTRVCVGARSLLAEVRAGGALPAAERRVLQVKLARLEEPRWERRNTASMTTSDLPAVATLLAHDPAWRSLQVAGVDWVPEVARSGPDRFLAKDSRYTVRLEREGFELYLDDGLRLTGLGCPAEVYERQALSPDAAAAKAVLTRLVAELRSEEGLGATRPWLRFPIELDGRAAGADAVTQLETPEGLAPVARALRSASEVSVQVVRDDRGGWRGFVSPDDQPGRGLVELYLDGEFGLVRGVVLERELAPEPAEEQRPKQPEDPALEALRQQAALRGRTTLRLNALEPAWERFKADVGRSPGRLAELLEAPAQAPGWAGPYLAGGESALQDAWGRPFHAEVEGEFLYVYSLGADGATRDELGHPLAWVYLLR
ncbi:MAG: type II secretion system protein GspG [Planctomycetota bacterium]